MPCQHGLFYHRLAKHARCSFRDPPQLPDDNLAAHNSSNRVLKGFSQSKPSLCLRFAKILTKSLNFEEVLGTAGLRKILNTYRAEYPNKMGFAG